MLISNVASFGAVAQSRADAGVRAATTAVKQSFAAVLAESNDFVKGTPAQQMEKQVLAKLGNTEKELKEMAPAERAKVMEQVREMIQR